MSIILSCRMTQMLRRFAFVLFGRSQDLYRAARLLDRGDSGFRCAMDFDGQLGLEFTSAEQPDAVLGAPDHPRLHQRGRIDRFLGVEQLAIDRLLNPIEIDLGELQPENIVEATLRQTAMQRHLASLDPLDAHAGTRGLALAAAARCLALA